MRVIVLLITLLYSIDATTEGQMLAPMDSAVPEFIGAPCSLQSDYDASGKCVVFEVRKPRRWK